MFHLISSLSNKVLKFRIRMVEFVGNKFKKKKKKKKIKL